LANTKQNEIAPQGLQRKILNDVNAVNSAEVTATAAVKKAARTPALTKDQQLEEAKKWADAANKRATDPNLPNPASFNALSKKQKELVRKLARDSGLLKKDAVVVHANSPTNIPGILYELRRLRNDTARRDAGLKDWQAGSVAKIGETTYFKIVGGKIVQDHRYEASDLRGLVFVVVEEGTQIEMRKRQSAAIAAYVAEYGQPPELNIAAKKGKGYV
jgi:hypothetical protein